MLLRQRRTGVVYLLMVLAGITAVHATAAGQSQALNGQIEGIVKDANGSAVPGASITIRNIETGAERAVTSGGDGVYRAPLLPLGTYRITVEAPNFKKLIRDGITLTAGQTATIDLGLEAGDLSAT